MGYTKLSGYSESLLQSLLHTHPWITFLSTPHCFLTVWLIVQLFAPNGCAYDVLRVKKVNELASLHNEEDNPVAGNDSLSVILHLIMAALLSGIAALLLAWRTLYKP